MPLSFPHGVNNGLGYVYPKERETTDEIVEANSTPNVVFTEMKFNFDVSLMFEAYVQEAQKVFLCQKNSYHALPPLTDYNFRLKELHLNQSVT